MRILALTLVAFLVASSPALAVRFLLLDDELDDIQLVRQAQDQPAVKPLWEKIDEYQGGLLRLKERDFIALFGKAQAKPAKTFAMPVSQSRVLRLSGIRYADPARNKDHRDFYVIKDVAALEVYYHIDGESPGVVILYFPAGKDFPRLGKDNLEKRLAWDADHLRRLRAHTEARMAEVFPWVVDREELVKLQAGDYSADAASKLRAWVESGKTLGYTYRHAEGSNDWSWYRPDGRLARRAHRGAADGPPVQFFWLHENGAELRKETFGYRTGELESRRWCRAEGFFNIRYETRDTWCWYGKDGKVVRQEWDDNGDGIPDWYMTGEDGIAHVFDRQAMEKRKALKVADSWAVNSELIPADSRIPDQPALRVPVRRRGTAERPKEAPRSP
jgi:hypothetical protein